MKSKFISLLAILLGLIIIIFPVMGVIGVSSLIGLSVLLISIYLLVVGVAIIDYNTSGAVIDLLLGLILLFLSICLIFNPALLGFLTEISLYLAGIMLIIVGLASLINNRTSRYGFYIGIAGIILGVLYIIIGTYVANPIVLGSLIGIWLIISGVLKLLVILIGISADFDPVHKGHERLIREARKIADEKDKKVVVYLNKGYSANHAPFFVDFEARKEMALAVGADEVRSFEGLHHRLVLSYSVPIRLKQMIDDGVTDYITSASISLDEIKSKAQKFIDEGNFVGMPKSYTNRNEIRWYALNEFLGSKLEFHVVKELNKSQYSGRLIRQSIIDNGMVIPSEVYKLIPKTTSEILQREISLGKVPGDRNWDEIYKRMNTYSRGNLEKIAYLNGKTINEIIKRRVYRDPESIWAVFRRSDYGPVMTRLAISAIEEEVTKKEVIDLMLGYEARRTRRCRG